MKRIVFACAALASAWVLACSSKTADDVADNGGADEVKSAVATCDDGALASDRLQPGASGGPDARGNVHCSSGYTLCKIDPKGPDNDVCSDPTDCYACSTSAAATCNLPPKFGKLCPPGAGSCVQDPKGAPGDGICQKDPPPSNACVAAGGSCVALSPGSCAAPQHVGDANTYSCGGGLGVECCLPADPPANACVAAGGSCVALSPGSCASPKHVGDANTYSCGGGLGVECCLP